MANHLWQPLSPDINGLHSPGEAPVLKNSLAPGRTALMTSVTMSVTIFPKGLPTGRDTESVGFHPFIDIKNLISEGLVESECVSLCMRVFICALAEPRSN